MIYYILTGILYLLMISFVLKLYYSYHKDIEKLEMKLNILNYKVNNLDIRERTFIIKNEEREGDNMACKKGRGGRKK